jgi:hypothetical protein
MAESEVNIKITATDKASPTIKAVGKELSNFGKGVGTVQQALNTFAVGTLPAATGAMGNFSSGIAQLTGKLGVLIGTGGMAGLAAAALTLGAHLEDLKNDFADWVTGMGDAGEGLDKLDEKTLNYIKTLKGLQNQLELVNLTGVARTAAEFGQKQREVADLQQKVDERTLAIARLEALRKEQAKGFGISGVGYITPGLKATEESLKRAKEELADFTRLLGIAKTEGAIAAKTLSSEEAAEAQKQLKKQIEDGNQSLKERAQLLEKLADENYRNMLQIFSAVAEEQKLTEEWTKDIAEARRDTVKLQAEIAEVGRTALEKSLGTGVTLDAIERGLQKNADTAKKIIADYNKGLEEQQDIWLKLERQRENVFEKQQQQYERMIDTIREGAGRVFDAMLTKGESVFSSLAKFAEGVLQTMLRNVFQNAMQALVTGTGGLQNILGIGGGRQGGANLQNMIGGGVSAAGGIGGLGRLFGFGGGGGGAQLQNRLNPGGRLGGFAGSAAGSALTAGGAIAGQMVMMDAFKRGSALEGLAGGAMAGASIGTMIAPGIGTAIGAGVGAIAGLVTGLFGGGAQRRAEEAAKRAAMIEANQFAAPETITRYGTWGGPGEFAVEPDLTGQIRGIGRVPTVVVNVENNMIDARHAREAGEVIGQAVSQQILAGGSYLADNIAWAAGAP